MNLNELLKKLREDKDFAQNYKGGLDMDAWVEQAKKDGCNITKEDLLAYQAKIQSSELSESELSAVVGGDSSVCLPFEDWAWDYNTYFSVKTLVCPKCGRTYTYPKGDRTQKLASCVNYNCRGERLIATELYD